jgi:hypothetical protein
MSEGLLHNLWIRCVDINSDSLLLTKAYFDISHQKEFFSFLQTYPAFHIKAKKSNNWIVLWLNSDGKGVFGILRVNKKRCVLQCLTKQRAEQGKRLLESCLKRAIIFKAYSYQHVNIKHFLEDKWFHQVFMTLNSKLKLDEFKNPYRFINSLLSISNLKRRLLLPFNCVCRNLNACSPNELKGYKLVLEKEILTALELSFYFLRALEKKEIFNYTLTETLSNLSQLIDKLSDLVFHLEKANSFSALRGIENLFYSYFGRIKTKFFKQFKNPYFMDGDQAEVIFPLPQGVAKAIMFKWRSNVEQTILSPKMRLVTVLEKQPIEWIEAIYSFLALPHTCKNKKDYVKVISSFLKKESNLRQLMQRLDFCAKNALHLVLEAEGVFPYRCLVRCFGDDIHDGFYWREKPPKSIIGILRTSGLLFVGRVKKANGAVKTALIPSDLYLPLQRTMATANINRHLFKQ